MATTTAPTAAAVQGFSLFPTTVPKISVPNPHKKTPSLHRISLVDAALSPNGESIMIKMEEEMPPMPQFPSHLSQQQQQRPRETSPCPEDIGRAVTTSSPIDGKTPTQGVHPAASLQAKYTPSLYQSPDFTSSSPQPSVSLGTGSATTLVAPPPAVATVRKSPNDPSPIVPIRSMFPVYDPSVPLSQQSNVPQRPLPARLSSLAPFGLTSREDYRSSLSMPFGTAALRTAPASILNFPSDVMSVNVGPRISTQRELEKLWDASHGTEPGCAIKSFDLEMARTEEATFVFGSHPSLPFYTLQTYDTNEIAISKTSPKDAAETRDVVLCPLEPAARRLPPHDGLVSFIFPKLAAMVAINQSAALAREHNLAPTDRDDIEAKAVRRAAKQEACHLRFNARHNLYELEHPAIGRGDVGGEFACKSPATASPTTVCSMTGKPVLHITVTTDSPLPTITVTDPNAARRTGILTPNASAGPGMRRLSLVPQAESAGPAAASPEFPPLAVLDLTSQTLHLDANGILELMPSLFSIDCVVSAVMAVAVGDANANPALGSMEIWRPRPAPASRLGLLPPVGGARSVRAGSVRSYAGSVFYATIAEREEAEEEAKLMRRTHDDDVRGKSKAKRSRAWFGARGAAAAEAEEDDDEERGVSRKGKKNKKTKTKKIVVREFDLEKLGHYQAGDRKGEELPAVTRGALSGLVVGLKLVVWLLTVVVQVLAWMLVNVSRALTSEKF